MPHQCLSCGHLFAEGSSQILQGCPQCSGTRFFYTSSPVGEAERKALAEKAQKDLRQVVADMLQQAAPETAAKLGPADDGQWASLKASDLRKIVRRVQEEQERARAAAPPPTVRTWENPEVEPFVVDARAEAARERVQQELEEKAAEPAKPETVHIQQPGQYDIDVKGLLERNPIVVHKDGAYLIHLPSLFGSGRKD